MPGLSWNSGQITDYGPVLETRAEADDLTINIVTFRQDIDGAPMLRGLPNDNCSCPHWGYVLKGRHVFTFDDHVEEYSAGEAFYVAPGHTPSAAAGTELVMFSPTDLLKATEEALARGTRAMADAD